MMINVHSHRLKYIQAWNHVNAKALQCWSSSWLEISYLDLTVHFTWHHFNVKLYVVSSNIKRKSVFLENKYTLYKCLIIFLSLCFSSSCPTTHVWPCFLTLEPLLVNLQTASFNHKISPKHCFCLWISVFSDLVLVLQHADASQAIIFLLLLCWKPTQFI